MGIRRTMADEEQEEVIPKKEKRPEKLRKKKAKMKQHGKGLGKVYKDAVEKRGED